MKGDASCKRLAITEGKREDPGNVCSLIVREGELLTEDGQKAEALVNMSFSLLSNNCSCSPLTREAPVWVWGTKQE